MVTMEFESANAGWDPYVASLIGGAATPATAFAPEERRTQVMSITRRFASALHRGKP